MTDSITNRSDGLVVGTAGHIDHGKTSLVYALTGIDTDRLAEEKRRGISIELGFAHLALPGGQRISFIDVPGHERFIKNMLAGAAGIEAVLLVVAADDSVKPQTREHLAICRLLGIQHGLIALTKIDLVTAEQMEAVIHDVKALCEGTFLAGGPIIPVSAMTGEGLPRLRDEISKFTFTASRRNDNGLARLPLDRSFAMKGFGTVVTGTLSAGELRAGDTTRILPLDKEARIRGLQVHGEPVNSAKAGQRVAVNLTGVDHAEIQRGFTLVHPRGLETTNLVDLWVEWLNEADIPRRREQVLFHIGTAEIAGGLKIFKVEAGGRAIARVWLNEPVLALPGDRFVLRRPSPAVTVAGGTVVDAFPPPRLNRAKTTERLDLLKHADLRQRVRLLIEESRTGRAVSDLVRMTGRSADELTALLRDDPSLAWIESAQRAVSKLWIERRQQKLVQFLTAFHKKHPSAPGVPTAVARLGLEAALAHAVFQNLAAIRIAGDTVSLAGHRAQFSDQDALALNKIERAFQAAGFQPPATTEVLNSASSDSKKARDLLESLIKDKKLVRVSDDLIFHADAITHIRASLAAHKGRRFSVPEFKSWTNISRKYAIPLLEYLDHQRVTRRDGDVRVVL